MLLILRKDQMFDFRIIMAVFLKSHSMVLSHVIVLMRTNFNIFLVCHMSFDEKIKLKNNTSISTFIIIQHHTNK